MTVPTRSLRDPIEALREVSLGLVSVAAVVSLGRLFVGGGHLGPLLLTTALAHIVIAALRRRSLPLSASALVTSAAAGLSIVWIFAPGTTVLGIPTGETWSTLTADLDAAWALFGEAPTPSEPLTGFLVTCAIALWVSVFVADWAAFRLEVPLEAILPAGTIFVFSAVLADDRQRSSATAVAIGSALFFLLVHRVARLVRTGRWVGDDVKRGTNALLGVGGALLVVAVLGAALTGPRLPGAGSEALVELEPGNDKPQSRVTISPLVDTRRRLVDQANVEVFTVRTDIRSYWRLTALDAFDGRIWSSSGSYGRANGRLPAPVESAQISELSRQTVSVRALAAIWLPAAFEARAVESDTSLRYDEQSSTLIVDTDIASSDNITYVVDSALPRYEPTGLGAAPDLYPVEIIENFTSLPPDFPALATETARIVTSGATSVYDASLRLQNFFREQFVYDLEVPEGHSGNDLERFLQDRRGYCEQFAGSYAAMARALGIPSRVAVGFTPGVQIEPGLYSVRGEHAHAWPEVFIPGEGWVPFEPTPGRGAPFAENYTGVPEQQVESGGDGSTATTVTTATTIDPDLPAENAPEVGTGVETVSPEVPDETQPETDEPEPAGIPGWVVTVALAFAGLLLAAACYAALALWVHRRRRARRRAAAMSPPQRVRVAWDESLDDLKLLGLRESPAATHAETAAHAATVLDPDGDAARELASMAEAAVYSGTAVGEDDVEAAERAAGRIAVAVRERTTATQRTRAVLDPKALLPHTIRRRVGRD